MPMLLTPSSKHDVKEGISVLLPADKAQERMLFETLGLYAA